MTMVNCICNVCGGTFEKSLGHYNRAMKHGLNVYCNRTCGGIGRRKSEEEKKRVKAEYDKKIYNTIERKEARKRYYKKSYQNNPEKYREIRKKRYKKHLQYLRNPEYKKWKKEYDKKYLAKKNYGIFHESFIILSELELFLKQNMPDELKFQMGITNKKQKRERLWQRMNKNFQQQT